MRVLLVGDIHLADRPPSLRTETYTEDIFAKLWFTKDIAIEQRVDAVVWAGDVFHVKAPTRTSHGLVQGVAEIGQSYECPWLIVPGNHDIQHDRLDTLERQPLGVLFKAGAIPLVGEVWPEDSDDLIFGIPWLADWKADLPTNMAPWRDRKYQDEASLMVTHAPIAPPGKTYPYEYIAAEDWADLMGNRGFVYYGHMHDPDGLFEAGGVTFCNQGALSRGSLHESTLARKPAVTLFDGTGFERIEVPHRPVEEVFRLAVKELADDKEQRLDVFLDSIGSTTLEAVSIEGVLSDLRERGVRQEVIGEIEELLEVTT